MTEQTRPSMHNPIGPSTTVIAAGGGPAGMMLGLQLARAGIDVVVLEKHGDFLRDFRGDTIHPSTLELIDELGLTEEFGRLPHTRIQRVGFGDFMIGSLAELRLRHPYIAIAPQWDFLSMLAERGREYPTFHLAMRAEVTDVLREDGRVAGVRWRDEDGAEHELRAALTVATDGRHSTLRAAAGLPAKEFGSPIDVVWFRLPRRDGDFADDQLFVRIAPGYWIVGIPRPDHIQFGYVIAKNAGNDLRETGIAEFRRRVAAVVPEFADRVDLLASFDDTPMLTVRVDRAVRWHRPGLLLIGDAAHAMSPVAGVGINLAVQDAVAAANLLFPALAAAQRDGTPVPERALHRVQRRRQFPVAVVQRVQRAIQDRLVEPTLGGSTARPERFIRVLRRLPAVRHRLLRTVAVGVRPEHVHTPERATKP